MLINFNWCSFETVFSTGTVSSEAIDVSRDVKVGILGVYYATCDLRGTF